MWALDDDKDDHTDSNSGSPFTIQLKNMGKDNTYDHIFEKAARRWEQIIIGDLPDVKKKSDPNHDWFGGEWKNAPVNMDIDDVLIGYSMEKIDGNNGVLGFAGPVYSRDSENSISAVSGIMKFDKEDFRK